MSAASDPPRPVRAGEKDGAVSEVWTLEGLAEGTGRLVRVPLTPLPFVVGRGSGLGLALGSGTVSQRHAEIFDDGGRLALRDLGSTNGTYVNGQRVADAVPLSEGDTVHFAQLEFRLTRREALEPGGGSTVKLPVFTPPEGRVERLRLLPELLSAGAVEAVFQPIVALASGRAVAYEALGRGRHPDLPQAPAELFALAEEVGLASDLDRAFRAAAVTACGRLPGGAGVFFNCRPEEVLARRVAASFRGVRDRVADRPLTVEIPESAVTDLATIRAVRDELAALRIGLAYDDFGAGQARLVELVEVPPDYVKFDVRLVHGIDGAPAARRRLLASLVAMVAELGIAAIAEGVETAGEAAACADLGFTHAQGNFHGPPAAAAGG